MNNGRNANNTSLLEEIRQLSFVKTELELYLDTHPECEVALDYYTKTVNALDSLIEQYEGSTAPLTASGGVGENGWRWVKGAWPWQMGEGNGSACKWRRD